MIDTGFLYARTLCQNRTFYSFRHTYATFALRAPDQLCTVSLY